MTTARQTPGEPAEFDALFAVALREHGAGRLVEAALAYRKTLAIRPDNAEVHNNLGGVLWQQGKLDEAAECFQQAIALKPDYVDARSNLGTMLLTQGKLDEAAAHFRQALAVKSDNTEAHNNLGVIFWQQGKLDEAAARFERVIALQPDNFDAHNNLGAVLLHQCMFDQALQQYQQAIALRPDSAEAHNNLGVVLRNKGQLDQAFAHYEQALTLRPDYPEAHNNLGNVLKQQGKIDQALARFETALALRPAYADAHNNLGVILWQLGKLDEAAARYNQALALKPDYPEAQMGLAARCLVEGDYERGWPLYEGRLRLPGHVPSHHIPRWTGEALAGRSLLLFAEQGLGDALQFIRYVRLLKERGARIVLACQPGLARLLESHSDVDELFMLGLGKELPRCDFFLPLLSAPGALGTVGSTIPSQIPYLRADPGLAEKWRAELAAIDGFKIGIVWQGARNFHLDRLRSIPLTQFAPLARLPGVRLVSLQKGFGVEQVAAVDFPLVDFSDRLDDAAGPFMDTAAVIRGLDLVVTPDTAIAHLAGALGVPVFVALQFSPDWRWLCDREDSPWYPTMRLFRQAKFGEWPDVFARIAKAVETRH